MQGTTFEECCEEEEGEDDAGNEGIDDDTDTEGDKTKKIKIGMMKER